MKKPQKRKRTTIHSFFFNFLRKAEANRPQKRKKQQPFTVFFNYLCKAEVNKHQKTRVLNMTFTTISKCRRKKLVELKCIYEMNILAWLQILHPKFQIFVVEFP